MMRKKIHFLILKCRQIEFHSIFSQIKASSNKLLDFEMQYFLISGLKLSQNFGTFYL